MGIKADEELVSQCPSSGPPAPHQVRGTLLSTLLELTSYPPRKGGDERLIEVHK